MDIRRAKIADLVQTTLAALVPLQNLPEGELDREQLEASGDDLLSAANVLLAIVDEMIEDEEAP